MYIPGDTKWFLDLVELKIESEMVDASKRAIHDGMLMELSSTAV